MYQTPSQLWSHPAKGKTMFTASPLETIESRPMELPIVSDDDHADVARARRQPMTPRDKSILRRIAAGERIAFGQCKPLHDRGYICQLNGKWAALTTDGVDRLEGMTWRYQIVGYGLDYSRLFSEGAEMADEKDAMVAKAYRTVGVDTVRVYVACPSCRGKNRDDVPCKRCNGAGEVAEGV